MSDSFKYWEESNFPTQSLKTSSAEKSKKELTENVKNILDLYNLLSIEEKIEVKKLIREQKVF